jgi:predicted aldo/keto reductase-like oxidoreductase
LEKIRLGRTNLQVSRSGFGAIPIQRIGNNDAVYLLRKALDNGINFYDTARAYTDSEVKIGMAFSGLRDKVILATKSTAMDSKRIILDLETSLSNMKTDYVDIFQFHNPKDLQEIVAAGGVYEAIRKARDDGKIRFIGFTNHRLPVALDAMHCGLFDTIQFPFNQLSSETEINLAAECKKKDVGFIAMKALSGGLITSAASSCAFLRQYDNVVPIWGIQHEWELDEILSFESQVPVLDKTMWALINKDRAELSGSFCRGCGYCLPCPAQIPIPTAARISLLLNRTVFEQFLEDDFKKEMEKINNCIDCGHCKKHCPYELDTPQLLRSMLKAYEKFYLEKTNS